jgi:hypothetical protein
MSPEVKKFTDKAYCFAGYIFLIAGFLMLMKEMLGNGEIHPSRKALIYVDGILMLLGLWMLWPKRTEKLLTRVGTYLPDPRGRRRGDIYIEHQVEVPAEALPPEQKAQVFEQQVLISRVGDQPSDYMVKPDPDEGRPRL